MGRELLFLYKTAPGRLLLQFLTWRPFSVFVGKFLDSPLSVPLIHPFVKKNHIELKECEQTDFRSFNDCFTRKLKPEKRPVDRRASSLVAPCDGMLSVWEIRQTTVLPIKQSRYTVEALLQNTALAKEFEGGTCLVYRLCVQHYHRYFYLDDGWKEDNIFIPGVLHTVRPIALREIPVFTENCREYTLMHTAHFGKVVQVEVGAMLVGKIRNYHRRYSFSRGEEKGCFLYGGSTIIVLLQKNRVNIFPDIRKASLEGREVPVRLGQAVGEKLETGCKKPE